MKYKKIEKAEAPKTKRKGQVTIVQELDDITILNCYNSGALCFRHCVVLKTGEHATWYTAGYARRYSGYMDTEAKWTENTLLTAYGFREWWEKEQYRINCWTGRAREKYNDIFKPSNSKDGQEILNTIKKLHKDKYWTSYQYDTWIDMLDRLEKEYDLAKRENAKQRKERRIRERMELIQGYPAGWEEWASSLAMGGSGLALHNPETDMWCCSECGQANMREKFQDENGQQVRANRAAICPECGAKVRVSSKRKKKEEREYSTAVSFLQDINDSFSVMRHFKFYVYCDADNAKQTDWHETVRLLMYKGNPLNPPKKKFELYYNHYTAGTRKDSFSYYANRGCEDWGDTNPSSQRMGAEYLFNDPTEIVNALASTDYAAWGRSFIAMAAKGMKANYNNLMACADLRLAGMTELLVKGRFYRLAAETSERIWPMAGSYFGDLDIKANDILGVMGLEDMQSVNRLRDINGGMKCLYWLRFSERSGKRIPQETLEWLVDNNVGLRSFRNFGSSLESEESKIFLLMSPEQAMNYIKKQQANGYKGMEASKVIDQWEDYMEMAAKLKKKTSDPLIYKPADLKARHDEYVEECEKKRSIIEARQNKEKAKKMAVDILKRFPTSEKILKEIKPKFEWENDNYKIVVPKTLVDIIYEGNALHHCAGATDRYFDRICQHETYICFLRQKKRPKEPYYTIEVEPGGTIRQHRGMYDEEPEIEIVKPALQEWQKEIRKRMKKEDKARAKKAEQLRNENIAYLREHINEKNNRRVLEGLEEDLMAL